MLTFIDLLLQLSVMQSHDDGSPGVMGHQMLQLVKMVSPSMPQVSQQSQPSQSACKASQGRCTCIAWSSCKCQALSCCLQQANPDLIYTSSKADAALLTSLQQPTLQHGIGRQEAYVVRMKKSTLFQPRAAVACLQHLHVAGMPMGLSSTECLHLIGSMISLKGLQQLSALGGLLSILHQDGILEGENVPPALYLIASKYFVDIACGSCLMSCACTAR